MTYSLYLEGHFHSAASTCSIPRLLKLQHLLGTVLLPVRDVGRLEDPHGPPGVDRGAHGVRVVRLHHALLVEGPRAGLI